MERDLNHFINENYKTNEILASVLHSVRENYLTKVAVEKNIGNKIFFQGATAKNKALVAAFEQKLNKPIMVSKYCHLTGAYGVALELFDKKNTSTNFRGIQLYKNEIPVRTETCELCTNHCKYKIAEVEGVNEVYGFLCGRDYDSTRFVDNNSSGFNLVNEYHKHFAFKPSKSKKKEIIIGIPSGLYLFEDMFMWQRFFDVSNAFIKARNEKREKENRWRNVFNEHSIKDKDLKVVLLGRPYTVLSKVMNNNIPDIFAQKGVKTFFQNMLEVDENETDSIREVLGSTKWKFAAAILAAADKIAHTKDLYPVFITSFKCSPDSFIIEYFKQLLDYYKKPYLILQLDEYDSNVGYETRIEAALRSFNNHFEKGGFVNEMVQIPIIKSNIISNPGFLKDKVLLMPSMGEYATKLVEANLRRIGVEAHTLLDSLESIKRSLVSNTGQCLPLNIILQNAMDYIENNKLDPAKTVLWMLESPISCNLGMFISFMSKMLKEKGKGFENMHVYTGNISFADFSVNTTINSYMAFLFGGYLRKVECKIRPYEKLRGQTDEVIKNAMDLFYETFLKGTSKEEALKTVIKWVKEIELHDGIRPKVAIFGDIYARENDVFNQDLVRFIEKNGGEAITTPYSEYVKIMFFASNKRIFDEGFYLKASTRRFLIALATALEDKYLKYFNEILQEPVMKPLKSYREKLELFNLKTAYNGESIDNVLKIMHLKEHYPDIKLFVQTNPSYCCPSLVTEAMNSKMEKISGIPIVTIEYDGTNSNKNENIIPFLKYAKS